jgi:hypothetical protein
MPQLFGSVYLSAGDSILVSGVATKVIWYHTDQNPDPQVKPQPTAIFQGHSGAVRAVAATPNSRCVLSGGDDRFLARLTAHSVFGILKAAGPLAIATYNIRL